MLKDEEGKNGSSKGKSTGVRATNGTPAKGGEEIGKTYRVSKFLTQSPIWLTAPVGSQISSW